MSMSMVAAGGWSPRFDRVYGGATATEAVNRSETRGRVERNERDDDDNTRRVRRDDDGPGRRNPLVGALMQALKGLMAETRTTTPAPATAAGQTAAAAPTATSAPATTSPASTSDTGDLKDAAVAFAHELFSALRSVGNDEVGRGRHHHHHGHGHGHRREGGGYGNLAQGLRDLARTIDVPKATSAAAPSASTPPAVPAPTPSPVPASATPVVLPPVATDPTSPPTGAASSAPTIDSLLPALAAAPAGASVEININIQIKFNTAPAPNAPAGTPAGKAESPLLAAFKKLMDKLNPPASESGSTATTAVDAAGASSPEAKLKAFLLGIADALTGGRSGSNAADTAAPVGSLISVAA